MPHQGWSGSCTLNPNNSLHLNVEYDGLSLLMHLFDTPQTRPALSQFKSLKIRISVHFMLPETSRGGFRSPKVVKGRAGSLCIYIAASIF